MATEAILCNAALTHLGQAATVTSISPPDGSPYAKHCARFFNFCRDQMLEMHPWSFAKKRATLNLVASDPTPSWSYKYQIPSDCIKPINLFADGVSSDHQGQDYVIEEGFILTNTEDAVLQYNSSEVAVGKWSPLFSGAFTWLLAYYLSGPVMKADPKFRTYLYQMAQSEIMRAAAANANNQHEAEVDHTPEWIAAR